LQGQIRDLQLQETIAKRETKRTEVAKSSLKDVKAIYQASVIDDFLNS
jgi:hypothetical protein